MEQCKPSLKRGKSDDGLGVHAAGSSFSQKLKKESHRLRWKKLLWLCYLSRGIQDNTSDLPETLLPPSTPAFLGESHPHACSTACRWWNATIGLEDLTKARPAVEIRAVIIFSLKTGPNKVAICREFVAICRDKLRPVEPSIPHHCLDC